MLLNLVLEVPYTAVLLVTGSGFGKARLYPRSSVWYQVPLLPRSQQQALPSHLLTIHPSNIFSHSQYSQVFTGRALSRSPDVSTILSSIHSILALFSSLPSPSSQERIIFQCCVRSRPGSVPYLTSCATESRDRVISHVPRGIYF